MAHLFLVCDEWADIKLEPRLGARSEDLLTNIASRFRAVGIHVILCTQIPKVEVLTTRIKGVLPAKVAFSVPTNPASLAILDNGHCKGLEPVGRCLLQWSDEMQIQTPFINDATVREIVQGATIGHYDTIAPRGHDVTELEIMTWALQEDSGWLSVTRVYNQFRQRGITRAEIEELTASWEGREFVIGSSLYRVDPPAGSRARRLVAVDDHDQEEA
jgi:DNA segregation ATPase FtsK/SpoIIIE-like protein